MQWIQGNSPISFPGLGLKNFDLPSGFTIGPLSVNFYGLLIALGLMLAVIYAWKRCKEFGIREDHLTDGVLVIVPFAIICTRAFYVIFKWDELFAANPISALYIWNGGLAIFGGIIGAAIGVVAYALIRKIKLPALLDLVALGFLIGQCIGRWGNFFNREAFGAETESFLRMGLKLTADGGYASSFSYYHPTFLYESLWNLGGFIILHILSYKRKYDGQIALGYALWYGLGRAVIEGLRTDSMYIGPIRLNQLLAALACATAAIVLLVMAFKEHDPKNLLVNQVAAQKAAEEAALEADLAENDNEESEAVEETEEGSEAE